MGYTTDFTGAFQLDKPLTDAHRAYLAKFSDTRRMKRVADLTGQRPDALRLAVGLPVGAEGEYFVGAEDSYGQEHSKDVMDYNRPPKTQPGLWCQWVPNEAGTEIEWNGSEKFYNYKEWLEYIISNFLKPWGYTLNGKVEWQGEDSGDIGVLVVNNNEVSTEALKTEAEEMGYDRGYEEGHELGFQEGVRHGKAVQSAQPVDFAFKVFTTQGTMRISGSVSANGKVKKAKVEMEGGGTITCG
jgi:hypothetical protein